MKRVLSIGQDAGLLHSRNLLLQRTGAAVFSAKAEPALQLLQAQSFDLVVLCHTLEQKELVAACRAVHRSSPRTRLLFVSGSISSSAPPDCNVDMAMPWHHGPRALLASASNLLEGLKERRSSSAEVISITHRRFG